VSEATAYSPFATEVMVDPYPYYEWLRREQPVAWVEEFVAVSRYRDVETVLRDPGTFSSRLGNTREVMPAVANTTMITSDPPEHTALRGLVNRAFTPRLVAAMEEHIRAITARLLDQVAQTGHIDVVGDLAHPLPVTVIAEIMGVDLDRRDDFKRWSDDAVAALGGGAYGQSERMGESLAEFDTYFRELIETRRRHPRDDFVSQLLVKAESVPDAGQLVTLLFLLLVAGHETTTNLIGNGALALLQHPEALAAVQADRGLIPSYVEEALRWDTPVQGLYRTTTRDVVLADVSIPSGTKVLVLYGSANRDAEVFPGADRFDVRRNPNPHLAFASGVHFCLGAQLARLEGRITATMMLERFDRLRFDPEAGVERALNPTVRGLRRLPLVFDPR
jgi:cytochrome P450